MTRQTQDSVESCLSHIEKCELTFNGLKISQEEVNSAIEIVSNSTNEQFQAIKEISNSINTLNSYIQEGLDQAKVSNEKSVEILKSGTDLNEASSSLVIFSKGNIDRADLQVVEEFEHTDWDDIEKAG